MFLRVYFSLSFSLSLSLFLSLSLYLSLSFSLTHPRPPVPLSSPHRLISHRAHRRVDELESVTATLRRERDELARRTAEAEQVCV